MFCHLKWTLASRYKSSIIVHCYSLVCIRSASCFLNYVSIMIINYAHGSPTVYLNWEKMNETNLGVNSKFILP